MTGTTIITGYNEYNEVIITVEAEYNDRFQAINKAMDTDGVTHVTTKTVIKRG